MDFEQRVSNDGERFLEALPEHAGMVREHKARYRFALDRVSSKDRVLDCASGSGYGSAMLAVQARSVLGVDASETAVEYADRIYRSPSLRFTTGSAYALPLEDQSIDVYCSFETIEHVPEPHRLLCEARRVLSPGGKFFVSTPKTHRHRIGLRRETVESFSPV